MVDRTALKVGLGVGAVVLFALLARWLLGWLYRMAMLGGAVLAAVVVVYVTYRVWAALRDSGDAEADAAAARSDGERADPLDDVDATLDGTDAESDDASATLSEEEFEQELEQLREES